MVSHLTALQGQGQQTHPLMQNTSYRCTSLVCSIPWLSWFSITPVPYSREISRRTFHGSVGKKILCRKLCGNRIGGYGMPKSSFRTGDSKISLLKISHYTV